MHDNLPVPVAAGALVEHVPDALDRAAAGFAAASKAENTRRAYAADWRDFTAWCEEQDAAALPASGRTVGRYLTHLAGLGRSVSTIDRRAAAIASVHRAAGEDSPTGREEVRQILSGIRNALGRRPNKKRALTVDLVAQVIRKIRGKDLTALRDRALILLCFGAALRRSELVGLDVDDLERHRRGLLVRLKRSKTDQAGEGRAIAVPDGKLKIPAAVQAWLDAAGIEAGAIFRGCDHGKVSPDRLSAGQFARILKARCAAAGLDPEAFSGHSPRRGFATTAGDEGADLRLTANHMRHARIETTLGYMEEAEAFRKNAGADFL